MGKVTVKCACGILSQSSDTNRKSWTDFAPISFLAGVTETFYVKTELKSTADGVMLVYSAFEVVTDRSADRFTPHLKSVNFPHAALGLTLFVFLKK